MKECYSVENAEYAVAHGIDHDTDFSWWVGHVMQQIYGII